MRWDVTFYNEQEGRLYRVAAKRLTVGEGITVDQQQDELALREGLEGRLLLMMLNYPLLLHATERIEWASRAEEPEREGDLHQMDEVWQWVPLELTEDRFLKLDEFAMWGWLTAVYHYNPHRDRSYESIKKALALARQSQPNDEDTTESELSEKSSEDKS